MEIPKIKFRKHVGKRIKIKMSNMDMRIAITMKNKNQYAVPTLLNVINGSSAGMAPQYISKKKSPTRNQVNCFQIGL